MTINLYFASLISLLLGNNLFSIIANLLIYTFIISLIVFITLRIISYIKLPLKKLVYFELTPPYFKDPSKEETVELFNMIYKLIDIKDKNGSFSLEILYKDKSINLLAVMSDDLTDYFKNSIRAFLPEIKISKIDDYLDSLDYQDYIIRNVKLNKSLTNLLEESDNNLVSDPLSYLFTAINSIHDSNQISLQINLNTYKPINRIVKSKDKIAKPWPLLIWLSYITFKIMIRSIESLLRLIILLFRGEIYYKTKWSEIISYPVKIKPNKEQYLFVASIRILVFGKNPELVINQLKHSFKIFTIDNKNTLIITSGVKTRIFKRYYYRLFKYRSLSDIISDNTVLSSNELVSLYHFPSIKKVSTAGLNKLLSRDLPMPLYEVNKNNDLNLGKNIYHDQENEIFLSDIDRQRHIYILGGTGNGKSTMIKNAALQDIRNNRGLALIDPHGDLAESILDYIPKNRIKDVIYFDPSDLSYPIGLNILEIDDSFKDDDLILHKDIITEHVISLFRKLFSNDDSSGVRLEYLFRNAIQTAFLIKDSTIFTVYRLFIDTKYRNNIVSDLTDKSLKSFWENEFNKAGNMQRVKLSIGITAKIGRFLRSASTRRVLGQNKSTINFDDILNNQKILICNLAKGKIGEDTSALIGMSILAKLQLAAYKRANIDVFKRIPFYLYIDECQNFLSTTLINIISEGRKYAISVCLAEQSPSQEKDKFILSTLLSNVGTLICFRLNSPIDEKLLLPIFSPLISQGEIMNLPSYRFFIRIAANKVVLPFSGQTVLANTSINNNKSKVIQSSRRQYARNK